MKIRLATPEDAEGICNVSVITWKKTYAGLIPDEILAQKTVTKQKTDQWKTRIMNNVDTSLFVLENDGQILGFLWGGKARDSVLSEYKEIYAFYILPEMQGHGYGRKLFEYFSQKYNTTKIYAYVLKNNPSEGFYKKLGFSCQTQYAKAEGVFMENAFLHS
ncbi:MAG: GNAT family N-acetyltransferase [Alphaproteobacteria bacterium]|nr:GNAT family N-acetyltransferase [Alphaproteobacteria bacterium]